MKKTRISRFAAAMLILVVTCGMTLSGCAPKPQPAPEPVQPVEEVKKPEINLNRDVIGTNGVVAAAKPDASQVGVEILKKGGNAIDAAVATGFALGVLEPNASGLGGGGFMMVRFAKTGEVAFIDFREEAPKAATADMYALDADGKPVNNATVVGGLASGVPGEVAGLLTALEKYGTMSPEQVIEPAIQLAEKGIPVTDNLAHAISDEFEKLNSFEATKQLYLKDGLPYETGDVIMNPDLAKTLSVIAKEGKDGFYKGEIAQAIVDEVTKEGGIITMEDLANYQPKFRKPVTGTYRGYDIISSAPPSSGGTHVIELLNMMENYDLKSMGADTVDTYHVWAEAMKMMYADRAQYMGDTDFIKVPLSGLTNKEYAKTLFDQIKMDSSMAEVKAGDPNKYESGSTTHFSIMDKEGNMVAVTKSVNYYFGSGVVVPGTGIVMNNHMDDFNYKPGTSNSIEAGKRPLSSMSPTFVLKDGKPYLTIGSPGATRIITTVAQVISNIIDHDMTIQDAIIAPKISQFPTGPLRLEGRIPADVQEGLKAKGHEVEVKGDFDTYFGGVQGVLYLEGTKELHGGADPRRDGQAAGF